MSFSKISSCAVSLSENCEIATIRISGRSEPIVANVVGVERGNDFKPVRIFLRSRIHKVNNEWTGWTPSGAITTILTRAG